MPTDAEYLSSLLQHCINDAQDGGTCARAVLDDPDSPLTDDRIDCAVERIARLADRLIVPLCDACIDCIGGAAGDPDFLWRRAGLTRCGAADCGGVA